MFQCCRTPISNSATNEIAIEPVPFPRASRRRQLFVAGAAAPVSPIATPSGFVTTATPRRSQSTKNRFKSTPKTEVPTDSPLDVDCLPPPPPRAYSATAETSPPPTDTHTVDDTLGEDPQTLLHTPPHAIEPLLPPPKPIQSNTHTSEHKEAEARLPVPSIKVEPPRVMEVEPIASPAPAEDAPPAVLESSTLQDRTGSPAVLSPTMPPPPALPPGGTPVSTATPAEGAPGSARNAFLMKESAPPKKAPRLGRGKAPPPSARAAASPGGLRTRDRSKMVDLLEEKQKRQVYMATNFVRESIDRNPNEETANREYAFVLWSLLFAAQLEAEGKQYPVASVCAHISELAQGELATASAKKAAPVVQFFAKAVLRPALEAILSPNVKFDALYVAQDIRDTARVTLGERPPGLMERLPYLEDLLTQANARRLRSLTPRERSRLFDKMVDGFEVSRRGGEEYMGAVRQVEATVLV